MARLYTSDLTKSVTKGVRTEAMKGFAEAEVQWPKIATLIKSTLPIETYAWLGAVAKPHEWTGMREVHSLPEYNFTVTNLRYAATMGVDVPALEDEQYGQIPLRARSMGATFARYLDELAFTQLDNSFDATNYPCYDEHAAVDTTHSERDSGTQSNLGGVALSGAGVTAGIAAMRIVKDDAGKYLNIWPDTLVVHPDEEGTAIEIVNSNKDPDNANNPVNVNRGRFQIVVSPHITSGRWFLLATKGVLKPLLLQERIAAKVEVDETRRFMEDVIYYGVRWRGATAHADWRGLYGSYSGAT